MENPTFKNEKIELLVCINEILGELVFKYGISGCSRCLTLETIMNPPPSQIQLRQLFPSHLNHVSLTKLSVKGVSTLQCREYFLDGDWWPVVTPSPVHLGLLGPFQICRNSWDGGAWKARLFLCHPNEKGSSLPVRGARPLIEPANTTLLVPFKLSWCKRRNWKLLLLILPSK